LREADVGVHSFPKSTEFMIAPEPAGTLPSFKYGVYHLAMENCPHCQVAKPLLTRVWEASSANVPNRNLDGMWAAYLCSSCGRTVVTFSSNGKDIEQIWPEQKTLSDDIPVRARKTLREALKTRDISPSSSIFSCARAVSFMLEEKGIPHDSDKSLHDKIEEAAAVQIIIPDMKTWAHQIRLRGPI
jgi:Domain of unknown function (DUF4145)